MLVTAYNPITEDLEKSYLNQAFSAGVTTLAVDNNNRFPQNSRIIVGEPGREKTEIITVTGVLTAGTDLTVTATVFPHESDDPVYLARFDQVKFYRATSETGTYSLVSTQDMDVDNENLTTVYDDSSGTATNWYKISFYNSQSTLESAQSDPMQGTGFERNSVEFLLNEFLREVKDPNEQWVDRTEALGWLNEVNDDLTTRARRPYEFLKARQTLTRTANTSTVDFPSNMWKFDWMEYNYTDSTTTPVINQTYPVRVISLEEFRNTYIDNTIDSTTTSDVLFYVALDVAVSKFRIWPPTATTSAAAFYLYYFKYFDEFTHQSDVFETPNFRVYKLYLMYKFYLKRSTEELTFLQQSDRYNALYEKEVTKLSKSNRKDGGSPRGFRFEPQDYKGNRAY